MALTVYAALTSNGTALSGDTTMTEIGGVDVSADHIEVYALHWGSRLETEKQTQRAAPRQILPIRILKRIDQTTPYFYRALAQNQTIAGEIKIFDRHPDSGEVRHRFTLTIAGARVGSVESESPDSLAPANVTRPPLDVIELVPHTITYKDLVNSIEFTEQSTVTR